MNKEGERIYVRERVSERGIYIERKRLEIYLEICSLVLLWRGIERRNWRERVREREI